MTNPTVNMEFTGDPQNAIQAMQKMGDSLEELTEKVEEATEEMRESGERTEKLAEAAGTGEQRFIGFKDTITGTQDVITSFNEGSILGMAQGFADIAGGLEGFLIPILGNLAGFMKGPLAGAMSFVAAHPLLLALGVLTAAFVLLWMTSEDFRRIVIDVFNAVGSFISDVFGGVIDWLVDAWNGVVDFFAGIPRRIGDAFSFIGRVIGDAFKGALNVAIDVINWFIRRANDVIYGINVINPFENIPYIPQIARLHMGGRVPGSPGQESLAVLQAGETVIPASESGGSGGASRMEFSGTSGNALASALMGEVRAGRVKFRDANGRLIKVVI